MYALEPALKIYLIFCFVFLVCYDGFSQEKVAFEDSRTPDKVLDELLANVDKYQDNVHEVRLKFSGYLSEQRTKCYGEFNSMDFKDQKLSKKEIKKLQREERDICLKELKRKQQVFIQKLFSARQKFLNKVHQDHLKAMEESLKETLRASR